MSVKATELSIVLNYSGQYFTKANFKIERINGVFTPIFAFTQKELRERSVSYFVANQEKAKAVSFGSRLDHEVREAIERIHLAPQSYILVEKGTKGLDFELKVFVCVISKTADGFTADITESHDKNLVDELWQANNQNGDVLRDKFYESIINETIPSGKSAGVTFDQWFKKGIDRLSSTRFLDIDPEDISHEYLQLDKSYPKETLQIQASNGLFMPCQEGCLDDKDPKDMGALLFKNQRGGASFSILKPVELLHDIYSKMWLKCSVQYRYPQDAAGIAKDYPQLYREITQDSEPWRQIEALDEAPTPYRFGDKELLVPCDCLRGRYYGIKKGDFQFTLNHRGLSPDFGANRENLMSDNYALTFVKHDGQEYFVVYRSEGKKRFKKDIYELYAFHQFIPLSKVLANGADGEKLLRVLCYAYYFHLHRNNLTSIPIDAELFEELDTAATHYPKKKEA